MSDGTHHGVIGGFDVCCDGRLDDVKDATPDLVMRSPRGLVDLGARAYSMVECLLVITAWHGASVSVRQTHSKLVEVRGVHVTLDEHRKPTVAE